jgi:hypothetical protein
LKVLYLFAGAERKTSVVHYLARLAEKQGWALDAREVDLKRGREFDLTQSQLQDSILKEVEQGLFHVIICTPPCSTWSRVRMANRRGPPPLRSKEHLWGYPWVKRQFQMERELGNELVRFSIRIWETVAGNPRSFDGFLIFLFGEHPEDLGRVEREEDGLVLFPASIWQIERLRALVENDCNNIFTVAICQCCWGAPWRKPTRLLATAVGIKQWGPHEWPAFDDEGVYVGPLTKARCNCQVRMSLARKATDSEFRTTGTDVYPPQLDEGIANAIVVHMLSEMKASEGISKEGKGMPTEETDEGDRNLDQNSEDEGVLGEEEEGETRELRGKGIRGECPGYGLPIRCYYKGKYRTIHDGGGLISQGRWPVKSRRPMSGENGIALASTCKQLFMKWLQEVDEGGSEKGVKEIFWSMAGGRRRSRHSRASSRRPGPPWTKSWSGWV